MQYPMYVHCNGEPLYLGSFPDLPGTDARGNSFDELERHAQVRVRQVARHMTRADFIALACAGHLANRGGAHA